jgi:hypothetical protein
MFHVKHLWGTPPPLWVPMTGPFSASVARAVRSTGPYVAYSPCTSLMGRAKKKPRQGDAVPDEAS